MFSPSNKKPNNCVVGQLLSIASDDSGTPFYKGVFPSEILRRILGFTITPSGKVEHPDFPQALRYAARGKLVKLQAMLDENPYLLALYGNVVTRGGLTVENTSILECALLGGDPEMAERIMPYFDQFACGKDIKDSQLARCQEAIAKLDEQKPYEGLSNLIQIIKTCSSADITAALNKNMDYESELNQALKAFRDAVRPGTLTQPAMHYQHYQTLLLALQLLESEWDNLKRWNYNYDRNDLVWRQVFGYLQRSLPAIDRYAFAQGLHNIVKMNAAVKRTTTCQSNSFSPYPDCSVDDSNLSGLGFDEAIYTSNPWSAPTTAFAYADADPLDWKAYVEQKFQTCKTYAAAAENKIQHGM